MSIGHGAVRVEPNYLLYQVSGVVPAWSMPALASSPLAKYGFSENSRPATLVSLGSTIGLRVRDSAAERDTHILMKIGMNHFETRARYLLAASAVPARRL